MIKHKHFVDYSIVCADKRMFCLQYVLFCINCQGKKHEFRLNKGKFMDIFTSRRFTSVALGICMVRGGDTNMSGIIIVLGSIKMKGVIAFRKWGGTRFHCWEYEKLDR